MKILIISVILLCLAFPVFSQTANSQRLKILSDSMGTTVSRSTTKLTNYDAQIKDDGTTKGYASYKKNYEALVTALQESEIRLDLYIRTYDRENIIKAERDNYEELIKQLQSVKTEYDNFVRTQ